MDRRMDSNSVVEYDLEQAGTRRCAPGYPRMYLKLRSPSSRPRQSHRDRGPKRLAVELLPSSNLRRPNDRTALVVSLSADHRSRLAHPLGSLPSTRGTPPVCLRGQGPSFPS